jgi:hypothetical protein
VIDGRGLLAVHLNNLPHHVRRQADVWGPNPLEYMAVGKVQPNGPNAFLSGSNLLANRLARETAQYYLFEKIGNEWLGYRDYTNPVDLPRYLNDPGVGRVMPLSAGTALYDFVNGQGHKNIGSWIDLAAQRVGR